MSPSLVPPAEDVVPLVNKAELAPRLGVSLPTLNRWIAEDPGFPVEVRGANGSAYRFDLRAVLAWKAEREAAEAEREARRLRAIDNLTLFTDDQAPADNVLSARERLDELRAAQQSDALRIQRGNLVRAERVQAELAQNLATLNAGLRAQLNAVIDQFGLDGPVIEALRAVPRRAIADVLRNLTVINADAIRAAE